MQFCNPPFHGLLIGIPPDCLHSSLLDGGLGLSCITGFTVAVWLMGSVRSVRSTQLTSPPIIRSKGTIKFILISTSLAR